MEWYKMVEIIEPYVVQIEAPYGSGTGFLFAYNEKKDLCAFATAAHVVEHASDWREPIKLIHYKTKKTFFLTEQDRFFDIDSKRDSASVFIRKNELDLPENVLSLLPAEKIKKIGVEVGWVGFPSNAKGRLCFFKGCISAFVSKDDFYFIDGVAINGVSGGPVFSLSKGGPELIGTVTQYAPNRQRGETLPGLLVAQDLTAFHKTIKRLKSLDEARRQKLTPTQAPQDKE